MQRLKRYFLLILCLVMSLSVLAGCSSKKNADMPKEDLTLYAGFYPIYAIAAAITDGASDVKLHCLVQPQDGCFRNYELSDWDFALVQTADVVILGGRGLESFEALLKSLGEHAPVVISALVGAELKASPKPDDAATGESAHWIGENPHAYMSMDGASKIAQNIADALSVIDPKNEKVYRQNLQKMQHRLDALHDELSADIVSCKGVKAALLNEALIYLADEYEMEVVLRYPREAGEEMDEQSLKRCLDRLASGGAELVLLEKQAPKSLCDAIREAGYRLALVDVLTTRTADDGADGYFDALRKNAQAIISAVSSKPETIDGGIVP